MGRRGEHPLEPEELGDPEVAAVGEPRLPVEPLLGAAVGRDGVLDILSNNHVLARTGLAVIGEDDSQPSFIDSGCRTTGDNVVGDFAGDIVPLGTANVDVGLSVARPNVDSTGAIL